VIDIERAPASTPDPRTGALSGFADPGGRTPHTMTTREQHPPLIDLDTGDEYEWITEPAGGGEPGYAHVEDHDWAWPREALGENGARIAEIAALAPDQVAALRARYRAGDDEEE
jgi:hypothetical protein